MRRKIACYITAAVTVLFMVLRIVAAVHPHLSVGSFSLEDCMISIAILSMLAITLLCFSKSNTVSRFTESTQSAIGWIATFSGAMLIMSTVLDLFCWIIYHQVPPPNRHILNNVDFYSLVCSLLFGACGGVFMILQGFNWMAQSTRHQKWLAWLSLTPVLWMWFRLARYEISYASTIDISESFFDFASLVTASLFFLQLARVLTGIGAQPKNGLVIFAFFTTIASLSGAPLTFYRLSQGATISNLLIAIVDATVGLLAFMIAVGQIFSKPQEKTTEQDDAMAWTTPAKERKPLDPPFSIDEKLPSVDSVIHEVTQNSADSSAEKTLSVDDILAELNKDSSF